MMKPACSAVHVENGPIGKTLLFFALPVLASQLLQELYNITDCMIVGHFAGEFALAATGFAGMLLSVLINFFIGFSSGISVITARLFGAYDYTSLKKTLSSVFRLVLLLGAAMTAAGFLLTGVILHALHCPGNVLGDASVYLSICIFGLTAQLIYNVGAAVLRSFGNTVSPLAGFALSCACNLVLDAVLVVGCHLGAAGAAFATLISQWLLAFLLLNSLRKLNPDFSLSLTGSGISRRELLCMLKTGLPAGMQAVFMSISSLLIQVNINNFGPAAMAGMTVYAKIEGCLYLPSFAFGIALTGFIGQNLGAGRFDRIRTAVRLSLSAMLFIILPLSLVLMVTCGRILPLFTPDAAILANAREAVWVTFPVYVIYALNQVLLGAVKGLGNTAWPMLCTLVCYSFFRVIWCRLLIPVYDTMRVVYLSYDVSFFLMLLMLLPFYAHLLQTTGRRLEENRQASV